MCNRKTSNASDVFMAQKNRYFPFPFTSKNFSGSALQMGHFSGIIESAT